MADKAESGKAETFLLLILDKKIDGFGSKAQDQLKRSKLSFLGIRDLTFIF
jgi:hypothetical protein